jgi:uncharacterized protein (DUF58 family)
LATTASPLIDRLFLEKLERLAIRWQKSFPGLVGGHNASRFAGSGQEFLDHRNFHHGDDLRAVNWRAYMRLEKLFLKMFQIEPRVPVRLLFDTSLSMTSGGAANKFNYARRLAAAFSYVGLVRLDTMVLHPFAEKLGDAQICSGGRHRFGPVADYLSALEAGGTSDYLRVARDFVQRHVNRGLIVVISDFLGEGELDKPFQYLAEFGHELMLVQLWSEEDRTPPWDGELALTDIETGTEMELDFDVDARERYTAAFDEFREKVRRMAIHNGGRYVGLSTSMPLEEAIFGPVMAARGVQ